MPRAALTPSEGRAPSRAVAAILLPAAIASLAACQADPAVFVGGPRGAAFVDEPLSSAAPIPHGTADSRDLLPGRPQGDAGQPVASTTAAIIGGTRITGARFIMAVARNGHGGEGGLCSGTVIGDYAVLTAKHCVFAEVSAGRWDAVPPADLVVIVGHDVNEPAGIERVIQVQEVRTTVGSDVDADVENGNDLAVLLLTEAIGEPARRFATDGPLRGDGVTIFGFGRTMPGAAVSGDSGRKFRGTARVNAVAARLFETTGDSWTCQGDSGGPAIASDNAIVGVISFGARDCNVSNSYYTRVAPHAPLIRDALRWTPPCDPSPEICDGQDNDCNGRIDEGCTALGVACRRSDECAMGTCEDVAAGRVCVRACDPTEGIPRCPFGFYCEVTGCGSGRCVAGVEGGLGDGELCAADGDCFSLHCGSVDGGAGDGEPGTESRCGRACASAGAACPDGQVCESGTDDCGTCLPVEYSRQPRPFGTVCDGVAQCAGGLCEGGRCTQACDDGSPCPAGSHCRAAVCVDGELGGLGQSCSTDDDCAAANPECLDIDGDRRCSRACDGHGSCGLGFACGPTTTGDRCVPPGSALGEACGANGDCRTGVCANVCTRVCDAERACPTGYECIPAGAVNGCFVPATPKATDRGGCAITAGGVASASEDPASSFHWLALAAMAAFRRRLRRAAVPS